MKNFVKKTLLLSTALMAISGQATVWETKQQWNPELEAKYSKWVRTDYSTDIFMTGKYRGIPTDCADAVYSARAIFAYENGLPFAVRDLTGSLRRHTLITNEMSRFDKNKNSMERFKKFLIYIFDITNTKSISYDSYPIAINRDSVKPGAAWVRARITARNIFTGVNSTVQPGHAEVVKYVKDTGVIFTIHSTVPQGLRHLKVTSGLVFMPTNKKVGLRKMLAPHEYFKDESTLPNFSLEQYKLGFDEQGKKQSLKRWAQDVQNRLKLRDESKEEMVQRYADNLCAKITERVDEVMKGEKKRVRIGRCMNEREYDLYSTPSRDKKIKDAVVELVRSNYPKGWITRKKMKTYRKYLKACESLEYSPGKSINIIKAMRAIYKGKASSDPNQTLDARWGVESTENTGCKIYY